jgi:hypothetical protein
MTAQFVTFVLIYTLYVCHNGSFVAAYRLYNRTKVTNCTVIAKCRLPQKQADKKGTYKNQKRLFKTAYP